MFLRLKVGRVELSDSEFKDCSGPDLQLPVRAEQQQQQRVTVTGEATTAAWSEGKRGRSGACQETRRVFSLACGLSVTVVLGGSEGT